MTKLLFFITEDWYFYSHRLPLARAAVKLGFEVVLLTNLHSHADLIQSEGIRIIPLPLKRRSLNPFREFKTLLNVIKAYRDERPNIVHHVAMKPVLYGSIAAFLTGIPNIVNALAGMGYLFISNRFITRMIRGLVFRLFRILLNREHTCLILQNNDDAALFLDHGVIEESRIHVIKGSGVDATRYVPTQEPQLPITVILPARMLLDKGVLEFVEAARIITKENSCVRFALVGTTDKENPAAVTERQLHLWQQEQGIEWWGHQSDMTKVFSQSHIVCLPSYREGLPKSLLEAAACGKPIVAADVPGCREIVRDGVNGLLVPAQNSNALAEALFRLIHDSELRRQMGLKGREIVMNEFYEEKVVAETLAIYQKCVSP